MKTPNITFAWRFPEIAEPRPENCRSASHTSNVTAEAAAMALSVTSRSLVTSPVLVGGGLAGAGRFGGRLVRRSGRALGLGTAPPARRIGGLSPAGSPRRHRVRKRARRRLDRILVDRRFLGGAVVGIVGFPDHPDAVDLGHLDQRLGLVDRGLPFRRPVARVDLPTAALPDVHLVCDVAGHASSDGGSTSFAAPALSRPSASGDLTTNEAPNPPILSNQTLITRTITRDCPSDKPARMPHARVPGARTRLP